MAKTVAPLLSFEGSGQVAKTQVYASWKGRSYVRRYVIPANPNSSAQQLTRNTFKFLSNLYKFFPGSAVNAWELYADSNRFTARNGFIKLNNGPLREETDLTAMTISPSARSGLIAASITLTEGDGQITVDLAAPSLPTGWTVTAAYAAAIPNVNPQTSELYQVVAGSDDAAPWSIILNGLTNAQEYVVGGWFQFTRSDGSFAYGQSLQDLGTPTV